MCTRFDFYKYIYLTLTHLEIDGIWRTEIIRDTAVIRAYVRGRQLLEEEATLADSLAPTGDADKDKRAKKRLVHFHWRRRSLLISGQTRRRNCSNEKEPRETLT
jgi:hypothetical protein